MEPFLVPPEAYARNAGRMRALCAFNRINALGCIESARHGWLGATFSCAELLTALYFELGMRNVVLSKGHAAPMQYACLHGLGLLGPRTLLSYKDGPPGLQAHTDRATPGILVNTGSLGQALSKVAGLALARPADRFAVVLGDGELQEGQVFEACQTVAYRRLANVTVVVDCNGFQSKRRVEQVKAVGDLVPLFAAIGLAAVAIDGHDVVAISEAFRAASGRPAAIVARTVKAGGSRYLQCEGDVQPWHGRVPDEALYADIVREQAEIAADEKVRDALERHLAAAAPPVGMTSVERPSAPAASESRQLSTGDAFAARVATLLESRPELVVLDADLADPCGIAGLAGHARFLEMGISEQDMVSFAGGLALAGKLPVVNTFAAFLKRAYEQIYVNATEGARILYAGHYAGLCYFTDGKTHQSINDLALMRSVPGMTVIEPATPRQTERLLDWAVDHAPGPVYFRLRRTPVAIDVPEQAGDPTRAVRVGADLRRCFFTTGTVSTRLALDCRAQPELAGFGLVVQSVFGHDVELEPYRDLLAGTELICTIEEDFVPGTLFGFVSELCQRLDLRPRIVPLRIERLGASFRSLGACLEHFGYTPERVRELLFGTEPVPVPARPQTT